mmetsp:Transcript_22470/g.62320  ORF Transcript_22470/g.62320 Transcript_22470/m.62320 type:complete len:249 (-) Transcript_22470:452-1198(-)
MFCPFLLAQPTKFVFALRACHVHAPLVLLNWTFALWAWLGVGQDPIEVLRLCAVLQDPLLHSVTVHRAVRLLVTGKAEGVMAAADHIDRIAFRCAAGAFDSEDTARGRAPLELWVCFNKAAQLQLRKLLAQVRAKDGFHDGVWHLHATTGRGASEVEARRAIPDRLLSVALPASFAEVVMARGAHEIALRFRLKANAASESIRCRVRRCFQQAKLFSNDSIVPKPLFIGAGDIPFAGPQYCGGILWRN